MTLKEAKRIVSACLDTKYHLMGLSDGEYPPLPKVSLENMLAANRIVSEADHERTEDGKGTIMHMTIDPRGMAAMYAREMFRHDPADVLEAMGWQLKYHGDDDDV